MQPSAASDWRPGPWWWLAVSAAAVVTYWRTYAIPAISDDYLVIWLSAGYGEPGGWERLALDPLYRCRATFMALTHWLHRWFNMDRTAYATASLVFHLASTLLVLALGSWRFLGWRLSLPAALVFAIHHGHQEAVIWYSALPDAMACTFILLTVHAAIRPPAVETYTAMTGAFLLALASKESGVCAVPLAAFAMIAGKRPLWPIAPMMVVAAGYFVAGFAGRSHHLHYNDGTFELGTHFVPVILRTIGRMLWPWGWAAIGLIAFRGRWDRRFLFAAAWMAAALGPYAFLTYMPYAPSRHTYIASIGLAWIVALGWLALRERVPARALAAIAGLFLAAEWGYLWTRKHAQYLERAEPTEVLLRQATGHAGEILIRCFPFGPDPVDTLLKLHFGDRVRPRYDPSPVVTQGCRLDRDIQRIHQSPVLR